MSRRFLCPIPSRLTGVGPEIILAILRLSSPADLTAIASVCFLFYSILKENPSCWEYARRKLCIPNPPLGTIQPKCKQSPLRTSTFQDRGTSERALAEYLFGGGNCSVCGVWSVNLPYSFALNWRCCSDPCKLRIFSLNSKNLVRIKTCDVPKQPVLLWLVGPEKQVGREYIMMKSDMAAAKAQIRQIRRSNPPAERYYMKSLVSFMSETQMTTFNLLESWRPRYLVAVDQTRALNLKFLKTVALQQRRALRNLLKCPTLLRVFEAFNRDLTAMGSNDWHVIEDVVGRELKQLNIMNR
ncbi:hypothetical protein C8R43DRAFT_1027759 [Mycena crocata]|nr:hypothetical protein C8R43DRAFT_1027759 [Mycena crocata]